MELSFVPITMHSDPILLGFLRSEWFMRANGVLRKTTILERKRRIEKKASTESVTVATPSYRV